MKSILYVGATLMIGASIYGFVDYKKTTHRKELKSMYDTKETNDTETTSKTNSTLIIPVENKVATKEIIAKEKMTITDQPVKKKKISQAKIIMTKKSAAIKKKKLNYKLFSRAPLEKRYINKDFKAEELKIAEPVKIEKKEQ